MMFDSLMALAGAAVVDHARGGGGTADPEMGQSPTLPTPAACLCWPLPPPPRLTGPVALSTAVLWSNAPRIDLGPQVPWGPSCVGLGSPVPGF